MARETNQVACFLVKKHAGWLGSLLIGFFRKQTKVKLKHNQTTTENKKSKENHSNIHFASIAPQRCIFRYLNSGRDFLPIDINFNGKIKGYETVQFCSDLMTV